MVTQPYSELRSRLVEFIPASRLIDDPLKRLAYGTDASLYRLVPQIVVVVESEAEVVRVLAECRHLHLPLTFRAAGTSLSGQAISDSVLVLLGDSWRGCEVRPGADTVRMQPGLIGAAVNRKLAPFGRKIGPDPASIDAAMIGGITANNSSGMCCGTVQNSYHTLAGIRVVLLDGTVLDTEISSSVATFRATHDTLLQGLIQLAERVRSNPALAARIRHKYRMKNTTGYGLNALVDFQDPIDILTHLMVGSEGTLGFISAVVLHTVPEHANKASALVFFKDLKVACNAVTALKSTPVAAVELMDRAALRAVEHKTGMPSTLTTLGPECAALLIETRAPDAVALAIQVNAIDVALSNIPTVYPYGFSSDAIECAKVWNVRKGLLPSVGAVRDTGTTTLTEDVVFPVERLAEATLDTQALLRKHQYYDAIIFGHALEGNLHFVFSPDFGKPTEVERYRRLMDDVTRLVVNKYDGALKAEHGTGRNMAPFVALEWGDEGRSLMVEIKRLFDPDGLLNPGVLLNDDPEVHLKNLKPMPAASTVVDKCMECGLCESLCPSHRLSFSPRQRIVGWREICRVESIGDRAHGAVLRKQYDYLGLDTCATCGLCESACPVGIDTGSLIKSLRGQRASTAAKVVAKTFARNYGLVTGGLRLGLGAVHALHSRVGVRAMQAAFDSARKISGDRLPRWSPTLPRAVKFVPPKIRSSDDAKHIVYFPSCVSRNMGTQQGDEPNVALPDVAHRLFRKAGYDVKYPQGLSGLCCGQPFESKGMTAISDLKANELELALRDASEGRVPIVFDTSSCAYRMKRFVQGRLPIQDSIEFVHDHVLSRVRITQSAMSVAIHPVCSVRRMGTTDKLVNIARKCSSQPVVTVDDVKCCGFAGDQGFVVPELNEHALRNLKGSLPSECLSGYSTSRTCEIGLSEHGGLTYKSILYLVDACAMEKDE
jgi:D-lactate dehydrogenase